MSNMKAGEVEVYVTSDGLGRAAIVRTSNGFLRVYTHWIWTIEAQTGFNVVPALRRSWLTDTTKPCELYTDIPPETGLFREVEDARAALMNMPGFKDSMPTKL